LRKRMRAMMTPAELAEVDRATSRLANIYADAVINHRIREYRREVGVDPDRGE
jgi:hypothetical protein